jgi:predicted nucleotidyltransferase component of viral defense system
MTYDSPQALRTALERRLLTTSQESGVALDRLRRRVLFERIVARIQVAEPGLWVLKGGMALEVRLKNMARLTKDIDVGLRDSVTDAADLHERLIDALLGDPFNDRFIFEVSKPAALREDGGGHLTWRVAIRASLAGKPFGAIKLDVSPRVHELQATDSMPLPNSLDFAGIHTTEVEIIDVHRHAAEKFHAMTRDFGDRENSRVRDLLDLVLLVENGLIRPDAVADAAREVWSERNGTVPPRSLPSLPASWPARYERLSDDHDVEARTFLNADALVRSLWNQMYPNGKE